MILRSLDDVRMNLEVLKHCATVLFLVKTWYPGQLMTILIVPIVRVNFLFHRSSTYPVFPPYKLKFIFANIYESLFSREHFECKFFSSQMTAKDPINLYVSCIISYLNLCIELHL